jgi:hypothetical protein
MDAGPDHRYKRRSRRRSGGLRPEGRAPWATNAEHSRVVSVDDLVDVRYRAMDVDIGRGRPLARDQRDAARRRREAVHFDGTYLNLMLPVLNSGSTRPRHGQLTMFPNLRSFDGTFVDRFMVSPAARLPLRRLFRSRTVEYVPATCACSTATGPCTVWRRSTRTACAASSPST